MKAAGIRVQLRKDLSFVNVIESCAELLTLYPMRNLSHPQCLASMEIAFDDGPSKWIDDHLEALWRVETGDKCPHTSNT
jgi:hypothetical protein